MDPDQFSSDLRERIHAQARSRFHRRRMHSGVFMGVVVVVIGVLLLLSNMGIIRSLGLWEFWPVILIVFGLSRAFEACSPSGKILGSFVAIIGALWLAENLHLVYIDFQYVWPLLLIAFGLTMLWRGMDRRRTAAAGKTAGGTDSSVNSFVMFSGSRRRIDSQDFQGGQLTAMFGGIELDLRLAHIKEKAVVDATSMFGGIEITVPETWTVSVTGQGIFGGFEDKTHPPKLEPGVAPQNLEVTGTAMFGGVSVRN
jgi:predicted membrane protein